jgi:flavin reductase (DIM6/NTAB) family NADH-FMN oxidoreductase RutF
VTLNPADGPLPAGGAPPRRRAGEIPAQSEVLRQAMSRLSAGVAVVSASWQGRLHAMTATAVCSVSLEPPLVLVCVGRTSRFHAAILGSSRWGISLLAEDQVDLARHFSDRGRDLLTQFDDVPHVRGDATDAPLVEGALAWLECATWATHDGGDHSIVIGQVLDGTAGPGAPLTYFRGRYC